MLHVFLPDAMYFFLCVNLIYVISDGSGSIDREEFLQIPQIATNPLASRMIAIFDEEYVISSVSHTPLLLYSTEHLY